MKPTRFALIVCLLVIPGRSAVLSLSLTGNLIAPDDVFQHTFTLTGIASIAISTWSFGGGTNAAGTEIPPGGFDPLVALFSGPPLAGTIVTAGGNPVGDADTLSTFTGNCPQAGMVTIGSGVGSSVCGDDYMAVASLPAGIYTLLLSDANFIPWAINPGPPSATMISDGFADFTGGVFQTCNAIATGTTCINTLSNFAVDIRVLNGPGFEPGVAATPEPGTAVCFGMALALMGVRRAKQSGGLK